jgi:hypothetical protein
VGVKLGRWILNKRLVTFERKVLGRMFGEIKVYENWRKRYDKELLLQFGGLDIRSFVRISRMNWIGRVNRMDSKSKVSQVFNNTSQGSRLRRRPKTDGGIVYKQILLIFFYFNAFHPVVFCDTHWLQTVNKHN